MTSHVFELAMPYNGSKCPLSHARRQDCQSLFEAWPFGLSGISEKGIRYLPPATLSLELLQPRHHNKVLTHGGTCLCWQLVFIS